MSSLFVWITLTTLCLCHPASFNFLDDSCRETLFVAKIKRGQNAKPQAAKWMASVVNSTQFLCGGTLIHNSFVLTAAHCIENNGDLFVKLGAYKRTQGTPRIRVSNAIRHRDFSTVDYRNDIGLLKLETSVIYNEYIKPICIYLDKNMGNRIGKFNAYGWGRTSQVRESDILQTITLRRRNPRECLLQVGLAPSEVQICAKCENHGDTCEGDSGGPLISSLTDTDFRYNCETQFGIVSIGTKNCEGLGIYTDVSSYVDWIAKAVSRLYNDCGGNTIESILRATIYGVYRTAEGVLITDRHVLTNAEGLPSDPSFLQVDVVGITYRVLSVFKFREGITLLKLVSHVLPKGEMKPICMFTTKYLQLHTQFSNLTILGSTSNGLKYYLDVKIIELQECASRLRRRIESNQFCVASIRSSQLFGKPGDILSEKVIHFVMLGMVTYSSNGVYVITNVMTYTDLITRRINNL